MKNILIMGILIVLSLSNSCVIAQTDNTNGNNGFDDAIICGSNRIAVKQDNKWGR